MTIRKIHGMYVLKSHTGKTLGTFRYRRAAVKRENQLNYFKHMR